jgi:hypothetical protein
MGQILGKEIYHSRYIWYRSILLSQILRKKRVSKSNAYEEKINKAYGQGLFATPV